MNYSKIFKKQSTFVVLSVVLLLVLFIGVSYAIFQQRLESTNNMVLKSGNFELSFTEGSEITADVIPMSDETGLTGGELYTFNVKNTGSINAKYSILLYTDTSVSGTYIPHEYLRVSYDSGTPKSLSDFIKDTIGEDESGNYYKIATGTLDSNTNEDHNIRIWIKEDAPSSVVGNVVALKIKLVSEVNK